MQIINNYDSLKTDPNDSLIPQNIIVFSHLRWDFVYQRPQHLLSRFSKQFNVTFMEEPIFDAVEKAHYSFSKRENVIIMVPHISPGFNTDDIREIQKNMFNEFMENKQLSNYAFWYYTPMALEFSMKFSPSLVIYDCMDELSAFKFAPEKLKALERELLKISDIVFTGGQSLFEAKRNQHANIYPFPSSIEKKHFLKARKIAETRNKSNVVLKPNLGFYGVIDERFDINLIKNIAELRPDWHITIVGPVVKIDEHMLPRNANINYLGSKSYQELPAVIADWDIALIPFLLNESTRFISPTKTPEYLAAGLPVISTPITDVINPYSINKLVHIGSSAEDFVLIIEKNLLLSLTQKNNWLARVDKFLSLNSWDKTCENMLGIIISILSEKSLTSVAQ